MWVPPQSLEKWTVQAVTAGAGQGCQRQMEVTEGSPPSTPSDPELLLSGRKIYGKFSLSWSDFWDDVLKPDHGGNGSTPQLYSRWEGAHFLLKRGIWVALHIPQRYILLL